MDDNVLPNDSTYFQPFQEPAEQIIERKKESAKVLAIQNALKEHIKRLQERIEFYDKVTSVHDAVRTSKEEFMVVHNTYALMAQTLMAEKEYLEGLIPANLKDD